MKMDLDMDMDSYDDDDEDIDNWLLLIIKCEPGRSNRKMEIKMNKSCLADDD